MKARARWTSRPASEAGLVDSRMTMALTPIRCRSGDSPAVYCWELWNEISATSPISVYAPWSDDMLAALKELFPKQMVVQNLGSLSDPAAYQAYDQMATVKDNDFLQVHRYLDPGAQIDACRGPMDVVAASATRELLTRRSDKSVVVCACNSLNSCRLSGISFGRSVFRWGSILLSSRSIRT